MARPPKNVFRRHGRGQTRDGRVKSEFDQKTLEVRRVTRVVAGGKRFNFSAALVIGNRKGSVGIGSWQRRRYCFGYWQSD